MISLDKLKNNRSGVIREIRLDNPLKERFAELGVTEGSHVRMLRRAPLGDPLEFTVLGYNLSIRSDMAQKIMIDTEGDFNA